MSDQSRTALTFNDVVWTSLIADLQRAADHGQEITLADYQVRILLRRIGELQLYGLRAVAERANRG